MIVNKKLKINGVIEYAELNNGDLFNSFRVRKFDLIFVDDQIRDIRFSHYNTLIKISLNYNMLGSKISFIN